MLEIWTQIFMHAGLPVSIPQWSKNPTGTEVLVIQNITFLKYLQITFPKFSWEKMGKKGGLERIFFPVELQWLLHFGL